MLTKEKYFVIWAMGLMSGFSLMLTGNSLNFWLAISQLELEIVGIFAIITVPYALNFIWAPIFDLIKLPILHDLFGQRLAWVILLQLLLSISVYLISQLKPAEHIIYLALNAVIIAFLAASQDATLGGIKTEMIKKEEQAAISGIYIFGYRLGMLLANAGAIFISNYLSWAEIYQLFSLIILLFPLLLILLKQHMQPAEPINIGKLDWGHGKLDNLRLLINKITKPIGNGQYIILILIFLVLYRLPDNFISLMINPFLIEIGYPLTDIAITGKLLGTIFAMIGGLLGSYFMKKRNIFDNLLLFGLIHALAHILFIVQYIRGQDTYLLFILIGFEAISGGLSMAAYIAFIASLCSGKFRATQYAFFNSMMGFSRSILPAFSGYLVANIGWPSFFSLVITLSLPPLLLLRYLKKSSNQQVRLKGKL